MPVNTVLSDVWEVLETFEKAMAMIEALTLYLTTSGDRIDNDEDADGHGDEYDVFSWGGGIMRNMSK